MNELNTSDPSAHQNGLNTSDPSAHQEGWKPNREKLTAEILAPLMASPWRPDSRPDVIIGEWSEDGSHYTIVVPTQLRDSIIAMQNMLLLKRGHQCMD